MNSPLAAAKPVAPDQRFQGLDALRGVALFGILLANLLVFAGVVYLDEATRDAMPMPKVDAATRWMQLVFIEGKFYGIFSLLFGIGAAMQLGDGRDPARARQFRRRMLVLAAIGLMHSVLWHGDILLFYAVLGFMLPAAARMSQPRLLRLGFGLFLAAAAWLYLMQDVTRLLGLPGEWPFSLAQDYLAPHYAAMDAAQAQGDIPTLMRFNLTAIWADRWPRLLSTGRVFKVFGLFLIGMWTFRAGIVAAPAQHRPLLARVARRGMAIGLGAMILFAIGRLMEVGGLIGMVMPITEPLGILALTLGYAALFALTWIGFQPAILRIFQPLGQMALSVYLSQTLICLLGLSGLGLGWFMEIGATAATALAIPVIAFQLVLVHWWLRHFRFGPAEWLWRSLTYGSRQPMRRR